MAGRDDALTVVTAASSNHYRCLRNLLASRHHYETAAVVVDDIGLSPTEGDTLDAEGRHVVRFPLEEYPAFFGALARYRTPCRCKPPLTHKVAGASGGALLWMDADNLVHEWLQWVPRHANRPWCVARRAWQQVRAVALRA